MKICVFGDSIAWGASDYEKGGWVERLKTYYLENEDGLNIYNLGVAGDSSYDLLKRLETEALTRDPKLIIFEIGLNDSQYITTKDNLNGFKDNLSKLTDMAHKITDQVIFVGLTQVDESKMPPVDWGMGKYYDNESAKKYDAVVEEFCHEHRLNYIDLKKIVGLVDLEDGLHPNSTGHEKIFKIVLKVIDKFWETQK